MAAAEHDRDAGQNRPTAVMGLGRGHDLTRSIYLDVNGTDHAFAVYHEPTDTKRHDPAIVICPPFGWEEAASQRALRGWAVALAGAGHPVLRLSFPSTGDSSGSPRDPHRLSAWSDSVAAAGRWVRSVSECQSTVAVGLSFGGLIACHAAGAGAPLDGLVLWATPTSARDLLRQLRVLGRLEYAAAFSNLEPPPPLEGAKTLDTGGFLISAETVLELEALDLSLLSFKGKLPRGVLMLGRDGIDTGQDLTASLRRQGVAVSTGSGEGYGDLISDPQTSTLAGSVSERVSAWLSEPAVAFEPTRAIDARPVVRHELVLRTDDAQMIERPIVIRSPDVSWAAVVAEPTRVAAPFCVVLLNAGAVGRTGPNRMWVEVSRRWAARGVCCLRLDQEGTGEAGGGYGQYVEVGAFHTRRLITQTRAVLDELATRGFGERFVVVGMCSGAFVGYHALLEDPRVACGILINQGVIVWDDGLAPTRSLRRISRRSFSSLRRADTRAHLRETLSWLATEGWERIITHPGAGKRPSISERTDASLERLRTSGKRALMLFAAREDLDEELGQDGRMTQIESWPGITVERVAAVSHTFRPIWSQSQAHAAIDRALERELELCVGPDPTNTGARSLRSA